MDDRLNRADLKTIPWLGVSPTTILERPKPSPREVPTFGNVPTLRDTGGRPPHADAQYWRHESAR